MIKLLTKLVRNGPPILVCIGAVTPLVVLAEYAEHSMGAQGAMFLWLWYLILVAQVYENRSQK